MAERPPTPDDETVLVGRSPDPARHDGGSRAAASDDTLPVADTLPVGTVPGGAAASTADVPRHRYGVRRDPLTVPVERAVHVPATPRSAAPHRPRRGHRAGTLIAVLVVLLVLAVLGVAGVALFLLVTG